MGPYSVDLRQRIVDAYRNGEGSMREIAARFAVVLSTVQEYLSLERSTASVAPRPHGGGRASKIDEAGAQQLRALVDEKNDRTLDELIELLEHRTGARVSRPTMCRALMRLGLTRKKRRYVQANRTGPMSKSRVGGSAAERGRRVRVG
ncbi:transposase [Sorangium sp. So ce834]|uniref:IS630 transposase-related protein n=1 Tax=Sorangium sp. So ce834 TaxID=3133321 RepID=UPI003F5DE3D3